MSAPKDDDVMIEVILTLRRDGSMLSDFHKQEETTSAVAGVLMLGLLTHAQLVLQTKEAGSAAADAARTALKEKA